MARGSRERGSGQDPSPGPGPGPGKSTSKEAPRPGAAPKSSAAPPTLATWFEEAWHGWMKPVGGLLLIAAAYFAYTGHYLNEDAGGRVLLVLIIGGAVYLSVEPALQRVTDSRWRSIIIAFSVVWAVVALAPVFRTVLPGKLLGEARLSREANSATVNVEGGDPGPYSVSVYGRLRGSGEVDAPYEIELTGAGESTERIQGELKRTYFNQLVSRRGSGTVAVKQESTENVRRVTAVRGPQIKLSAEVGSDSLEEGLHVEFRHAGPGPLLLFGLGLLLVIGGIIIDYRMATPKADRTHLATGTGFTLAFGAYFPMEATPHNLVRPAIAGVCLGLALGALAAWGISAMVNSFKPRPKKLAGVKNRFADEE